MSNTNNKMQTQTSNALHNAIMEVGSKDRPPMLALDKEVLVTEGSSVTTIVRYMENYKNVSQDIRDQLNDEAEAIQIILTGIDNDIYSIHQNEVNEIRAERLARTANPLALVAQQQPVYHPQNHPTHYTQNSSTRSQQAATKNKGKTIVNSPPPIYDQEPSMVTEDDEMSKDKKIHKLMALISLSFKKIYKPTNNNLRTSSNTSRANQDNSPRINIARECQKPKRAKDAAYHREKMLLCKQEEARIQLNAEQDDWRDDTDDELEDQELEEHYIEKIDQNDDDNDLAKEHELLTSLIEKLKCEIEDFKNKNKSLESSNNFFKEANNRLSETNNLLYVDYKKSEAELARRNSKSRIGAGLNQFLRCLNEEMVADLRYFNSLESEVDSLRSQLESQKTQFLNENDRLSREYYYADHMNTILGVYTELDEVTNLQCDYLKLLKKCDGLDTELSRSKMMSNSFESVQKHAINLELELQQYKEKIKNDMLFKVNKSKDFCKEREQYFEIQDLKAQLQDKGIVIRVIPTTSVSRPPLKSNPKGDRVLRNNSQGKTQEVEDQRRSVKLSKNKTSHAMCVLNSASKPIKRTVASESNQKPRNFTKRLYKRVSKTCSWWYPKFTPSGYKWKPKSGKEKVNSNLVEIVLFIFDFGCSKHMTGNLKLLINFVEKFLGTVKFGNDQIAPILGYGDLGNDLLTGSRGTDLYSITLLDTNSPNLICLMAKATSSQPWLWHRRLSYLNFDTINLLSKNDIVVGLLKLKFVKDHLCSSCKLGKAKRKSFHTKFTPSSKRRLHLLHIDLCGPMRVVIRPFPSV
nr:hypothetical protein [Tanacetum cinerariifolium]